MADKVRKAKAKKTVSTALPAWVRPFRQRFEGSIAQMIRNVTRHECEAIAGAVDEGVERIEASVGSAIALREQLAVQTSHVRRLLAEKETLAARLNKAERALRARDLCGNG